MSYGVEKRYATKLIGKRCRIVTGLLIEPKLAVGDTGYYMQGSRDGTFTLFDSDDKEVAQGDFFVMCREARKRLQEQSKQ